MSGLVGFLLERIADDEDDARGSLGEDGPGTWLGWVLAECEARRRIIALHFRTAYLPGDDPDDGCVICGGWPCDTLQALALPYASHPDFDPSWPVSGTDREKPA